MPITAPEGYLDISNATLRGSEIITTSNVGIMNANPTVALSVGSNLHVNAYSSNVLEVNGNVVAEGLKLGFIEILPSYDLAAVSNVGNVTQSTIQFSNATTAFVTTANVEVGTANLFVDTTTGNVGVGVTNPTAQLTLGASSGSQIAVTDKTRLLSNTHYLNYTSSTAADFEQVLLQFDTGGTSTADQSEYAGYIDVEMVAQRTTSGYTSEIFTARLNYILAWLEQSDTWQFTTFVQENKSVSADVAEAYKIFRGVPVFKYKYVDRQLQIYVSFNANWFRGYTSFTARVTSDAPTDVSMPGPDALMASGTEGTAEIGMCYGVGANAKYVGIGTMSPQDTLHLYGSPLIQHSDTYSLSTAGWRKIGTFTASEAGARLKIRILGSFQYGAGSSRGGQTEIYGSINNGVGSVCNMSGTYNYIGQPAVTSVKFVQTGASELEYEVRAYFQTVTAHSFSVECTRGVFVRSWTASSDPGNNSSTVEAAILTHNISENGNVGIGTASPGEKLHVNGNLRLGSSSGNTVDDDANRYISTAGQLNIKANDSGINGSYVNLELTAGKTNPGKILIGGSDNNDLYKIISFHTSGSSSERMRIHHNGNVGIGVANPEAKLQVNTYGGESSTNCLIIGASTSSQNLRIGVDSGGQYCWIQSHQGKPLRLNPGGNTIQYGTSNTTLSDDRIKDNEVYIENATDTLLKLKPQIYDKKLIWNISKLGESSNVNVVRESGLITQDVWYDAPELRHLVHLGKDAEPGEDTPVTDNDPTIDPDYTSWGDNVSLLDYTGLIPYLIKSNQELYAEIQTLKSRITSLENP